MQECEMLLVANPSDENSFEISMKIALILQRSLSESSRSLIILLQEEEHNADSGKQIL